MKGTITKLVQQNRPSRHWTRNYNGQRNELDTEQNNERDALDSSQASPSLLSNCNEVKNTCCTISTDAEKPKAMGILTLKAGKLEITRDPRNRAPDHFVKDRGKREDNQPDSYD